MSFPKYHPILPLGFINGRFDRVVPSFVASLLALEVTVEMRQRGDTRIIMPVRAKYHLQARSARSKFQILPLVHADRFGCDEAERGQDSRSSWCSHYGSAQVRLGFGGSNFPRGEIQISCRLSYPVSSRSPPGCPRPSNSAQTFNFLIERRNRFASFVESQSSQSRSSSRPARRPQHSLCKL